MFVEALYIFNIIGTSLILGLLVFKYYKNEALTPISRFFLGVSLTPFAIATFTTVFGLTFKKAHQGWFFVIPGIFIISYLSVRGVRILRELVKNISELWNKSSIYQKLILIPTLEFVIIILAISIRFAFEYPILTPHDAGVYANEALHFVTERKIPSFSQDIDRFEPGHPHSFLYSGYISYGLFATSELPFGHPNDSVAILGSRLMIFFLFAAVIALMHNIKKARGLYLVPFMLLFLLDPVYNITTYFVNSISRDPFRIITLLLFSTLLGSFLKKDKISKTDGGFLALIVIIGVWAHTINIVLLFLIIFSWTVLAIYFKKDHKYILSILVSSGLGFIIGGTHYIKSFIDTGRLMGNGFYYYSYINTPLWDSFLNGQRYVERVGLTSSEKIVKLLSLDNFLGLLVFPTAIFTILKNFKEKKKFPVEVVFLSFTIVVLLLPYTGIFDFGQVKLSEMFLLNNRYKAHWMLFSSILIVSFLSVIFDKNKYGKVLLLMGTFVISYIASFYLIYSFLTKEFPDYMKTKRYSVFSYWKTHGDAKVLIDNLGSDYYIEQESLFVYDSRSWPITHATNHEETRKAFEDLGINYVLLERPVVGWWDQLSFYDYLKNNAIHVQKRDGDKHDFELYKLK